MTFNIVKNTFYIPISQSLANGSIQSFLSEEGFASEWTSPYGGMTVCQMSTEIGRAR